MSANGVIISGHTGSGIGADPGQDDGCIRSLVIPIRHLIAFNDRGDHRVIRIDGEAITASNQGYVPHTIRGPDAGMIKHTVDQGEIVMENGKICIYSRPFNHTYITGRCTNSIIIIFNAAVGVRKSSPVGRNGPGIVGPFNFCLAGYAIIDITCYWIGLVHAKPIGSSVGTYIPHRINSPHI